MYSRDRDLAEDVAQEALARACRDWRKVARLDSPEAWVHRVAINLTHSAFRRRAVEKRVKAKLESQAQIDGDITWVTDRSELLDALAKLPSRQRSALLLRYYAGFRVREVADALGCPEGTAKSLIRRGLRAIGVDTGIIHLEEAPHA
jgi:RNA polymerase sigma factor (sigma-70 family)